MKFESREFSKRHGKFDCAVFVVHEPIPKLVGAVVLGGAVSVTVTPIQGAVHRGTAAAIILPDGRFWFGLAYCSPQDQFVKKIGAAKAIGRAYQAMATTDMWHHGDGFFEAHGRVEDINELRTALLTEISAQRFSFTKKPDWRDSDV